MAEKAYEHPKIQDFGTLRGMTLQTLNKVGRAPDVLTGITNGIVIGSFVSSP